MILDVKLRIFSKSYLLIFLYYMYFQVAYYAASAPMGVGTGTVSVQYKTIASNSTFTTTLTELRKYVQYNIQVLAFTRLGNGELSAPPVRVRTFEDS